MCCGDTDAISLTQNNCQAKILCFNKSNIKKAKITLTEQKPKYY